MKKKSHYWLRLVIIILIVSVLESIKLPYYNQNYIFNSDSYFFPLLVRDIFFEGGRFSDWYGNSEMIYLFPISFLNYLLLLLNDDLTEIVLYNTILNNVLFYGAAFILYCKFYSYRISFILTLVVYTIISLFLFFDIGPFSLIQPIYDHFGPVVIVSLILLISAVDFCRTKSNWLLLLIILISAISSASDRLLLSSFIIPSLVTISMLFFISLIRSEIWIKLTVSILIGIGIINFLVPFVNIRQGQLYSEGLACRNYNEVFGNLLDILYEFIRSLKFLPVQIVFLATGVISLTGILIYLFRHFRQINYSLSVKRNFGLSLLLINVFICSMVVLSICSNIFPFVPKYVIICYYLPIILSPFVFENIYLIIRR